MTKHEILRQRLGKSCWLKWTFDGDQGVVQIIFWRSVIHEEVVPKGERLKTAARWWAAEQRAKDWARSRGFWLLKERLNA